MAESTGATRASDGPITEIGKELFDSLLPGDPEAGRHQAGGPFVARQHRLAGNEAAARSGESF